MNSLISELKTEDKLEYQFFPLPGPTLKFQVKANNDAHIAFTQALGEGEPMYEVFIGGWNNSKSVIRKNKQKLDVVTVETPGILTGAGHKFFWLNTSNGGFH
ncbi:C3 and PZP-like alpha-2-macroglobulin domain-containing protein 8 isoform X2 [Diaphorina citri]|uniref:C3 and PZP-like alpha-2-macroglobulin domain-containing protein 8 isoform X2 n=1 Tax=Diaphorina citri TaxID=121845 RepID=A0A3Q0JPV8_DIACI|nr:C3 and PZP-like alpha-2-macroglobulin domain-containing protein 8 isoform X2 [Diaphorina citri]